MQREFTPSDIERAFASDLELARALARFVIGVVHREVAATLSPMAARLGRDAGQDVDDLTQSVLVALFEDGGRTLKRWDPARGMGLVGFVALIARRRVLRVMSGFRGNLWSMTPVASELLDEHPELQADAIADVEYALELDTTWARLEPWLDARGRRLFRAIYVEQRPIPDVCAQESMSADAVHAWTARVRHKAREIAGGPRACGAAPRRTGHG